MKTKTFLTTDSRGWKLRIVQQGCNYKIYLSGVGLICDDYYSKHPSNSKAFVNHLRKYLDKHEFFNHGSLKGYLIF